MSDKKILFQCPEDLYNQIKEDAKQNGISMASHIRLCLKTFYNYPGAVKVGNGYVKDMVETYVKKD